MPNHTMATSMNREVLETILSVYGEDKPVPVAALTRRERYHLRRCARAGYLRLEGEGLNRAYVYTGKPLGLPYPGVFRAMRDKLRRGEAKDVAPFEVEGGDYRLPEGFFVSGKDYCDAGRQAWIWSIGRHRETDAIWASRNPSKYQNPAFECLWLR